MEPVFCLYLKGLQGSSSTLSAAEWAGSFQQGAVHYQFLITLNCHSPMRQQCNTLTQTTGLSQHRWGNTNLPTPHWGSWRCHRGSQRSDIPCPAAPGAGAAPPSGLTRAWPWCAAGRARNHSLGCPRGQSRGCRKPGDSEGTMSGTPSQALPGGTVEFNFLLQSGCFERSTPGFKLLGLYLVVLNLLSPWKIW